eukprot:gene18214-20032_t
MRQSHSSNSMMGWASVCSREADFKFFYFFVPQLLAVRRLLELLDVKTEGVYLKKAPDVPEDQTVFGAYKSAELDQRGGISLQSNAKEVVPRRYGVTPNYLHSARSSSYSKTGLDKQGGNHETTQDSQSPSRSPVPLSKTSNTGRWVPLHTLQDVPDRNEVIFRRIRGILNKLTPEKFDRMLFELLNIGIDNKTILKGLILLIFEKALEEPKFSSLYAQLCFRLSHEAPNFDDTSASTTTFRRLLLSKCQEEFQSRANASAAFDREEGPFTPELQEERTSSKRKMLGNIRFIGELGKMGILHEAILHKCIQQLLAKKKKTNVADMAEDIECLCQIMNTVGKRLDTPKARNIMDQYFERMRMLSDSPEFPSRIKFMLLDTLDLRKSMWQSKRAAASETGPRPVSQMRWEHYSPSHSPMMQRHDFSSPLPFGMPPPHAIRPEWFAEAFSGAPGHPMPPLMPGMFPPGPMNAGRMPPDLFMAQDAQKDIFGKDPVPKNQSLIKKLKDKTDLFEPHYLKNKPSQPPTTPPMPTSSPSQQQQQHHHHHQSQSKPVKSYASASLPSQPPMPSMPAKKFDLFDDDSFNKILNKPTSNISPWNQDTFARSSGTSSPASNSHIDSNYNQISQQTNKMQNGGGQQELNTFLPFPRHTITKTGQISLRPSTQLSSAKKEEEAKPEETTGKTTANAVNLIIKDKQEKPRTKKNLLSKPEYERRVEAILKQHVTSSNTDGAFQALKLITTASSYGKMLCSKVLKDGIDKDEDYWKYIGMILATCLKADLIPTYIMLSALSSVGEQIKLGEVANDQEYLSTIMATFIQEEAIDLSELCELFPNGDLYPGFIKCLQKLSKDKGEDWLKTKIEEFKIDVMKTLPVEKQSDTGLLEIAKEAEISFLFPILCIQAEFLEILNETQDISKLQTWIKESMSIALRDSKTFIHSLLFCVLKHATSKSTLMDGLDVNQNPEKDLQEKEKETIKKLSPLVKTYLEGESKLQIEAVYSLQQFCYTHNFPKGMLLRLFISFYDLEIIEEDAYLKWKEDINDSIPGKGKALFQVNNWLQWLETADEEDESDEEQI